MRKLAFTALIASGLMMSCNQQTEVTTDSQIENLEDGIYAKIETTLGDIVFKFEDEKAPITSANFIALAEGNMPSVSEEYKGKPYFDGLTFHRVIPGFMIQGGDPMGNGQGGPGYQFVNETDNDLTHNKGVVSMANAGPNTNGSQFFITVAPTQQLDRNYSIFGKVVLGQEVADSISNVERNGQDLPNTPVVMNKVTIIRKGDAAQSFDAPKVFLDKQKEMEEAAKKELEKSLATVDSMTEGYDVTESGLRMKITEKGTGKKNPETGNMVSVHYTGMLLDGKKFDSSVDRGQPIEFRLGVGQVIRGWDEGISRMKVGDKARLVIPPALAYGPQGRPPVIPANSWLVFDVELVDIKADVAQ
jgi:peptidylprolyl isomerase